MIVPDGVKDPIKAAKRRLIETSYDLLVFDNMDDPDVVLDFLPYKRNGDVLMTTRDSALAGSARFPHGIHLNALARSQSMLLFVLNCHAWAAGQSKQIRDDFDELQDSPDPRLPVSIADTFTEKFDIHSVAQLDNIGSLTGDLPLAIVQCASYLREYPMRYSRYLKKFDPIYAETRRKFYGTKIKDAQYDKSIMTTWDITFQKLETTMPTAACMLTLFGFLDRNTTSGDFLENALSDLEFWGGFGRLGPSSALQEKLQFLNAESGDFDESVGRLVSLSLVTKSSGQRRIIVHPLIHEWIHLRMRDLDCAKWISRSLTLLCSRLPPILYSASDREAPHQADIVLCHLDRLATLIELYTKDLIDLTPECAIFFLEAYLWYRGRQYLDIALRISDHVSNEHQGWVQRLIHATYLCQTIEDFQGRLNSRIDRDLYQSHLDRLSALSSLKYVPPRGTRFVLTEAAIAYRLCKELDEKTILSDEWPSPDESTALISEATRRLVIPRPSLGESTPLISKAARELVGYIPTLSSSGLSTREQSSSRLDRISSAILAYCGAKDYMQAGQCGKAYALLNENREGAALGISYGLPELLPYCKILLQAGHGACIGASEVMDTILYIDGIPTDTTLTKEWILVDYILKANRKHPEVKRFVSDLADRPDFLECLPQYGLFNSSSEIENWFQRRLLAVRVLGIHLSYLMFVPILGISSWVPDLGFVKRMVKKCQAPKTGTVEPREQ